MQIKWVIVEKPGFVIFMVEAEGKKFGGLKCLATYKDASSMLSNTIFDVAKPTSILWVVL